MSRPSTGAHLAERSSAARALIFAAERAAHELLGAPARDVVLQLRGTFALRSSRTSSRSFCATSVFGAPTSTRFDTRARAHLVSSVAAGIQGSCFCKQVDACSPTPNGWRYLLIVSGVGAGRVAPRFVRYQEIVAYA